MYFIYFVFSFISFLFNLKLGILWFYIILYIILDVLYDYFNCINFVLENKLDIKRLVKNKS